MAPTGGPIEDMHAVIRLLLSVRHATLALVVLLLAYLATFGDRVSYEQSIQSFFADDDPAILAYQAASATFGDDNFVFLAYDDPDLLTPAGMDRVAELAAAVGPDRIDGVMRVESLDAMPLLWKIDDLLILMEKMPGFARNAALRVARESVKTLDKKGGAGEAFSVGAAVRASAPTGVEDLRERLVRHPLFVGTLIDRTGTTTAVIARLKKTEQHDVKETVTALRGAADGFAARHGLQRPAVVGPPVLLADGFIAIEKDGRRLAAVGMGLIALVTLTAVRSLWWPLIPLIAGWTVWLATEQVLSTLGLRLSLSGGPLVAQIIVLTMPAASHLAIHFRDERRTEGDPRAAARSTLRAVSTPIFWTAITGAIGYGALVTSNVVPIQQFGWILGCCTLVTSLLVMAISPSAMLPPFRLELPVRIGTDSRVARVVNRTMTWVVAHPGLIVATVLVVVIPATIGVFRLRYESNYINAFRPETRVVRDYNTVESKLGGIGLVGLVVPVGPAIDTAAMEKLARFDQEARTRTSGREGILPPISVATVLDPDGRLARDAASTYDRALATKLELIGLSPQAALLRSFWNPEAGEARILVRLVEQQPAAVKQSIFDGAVGSARSIFGPESYLTGLSFLMTRTTQGVIQTQWTTFLWSALGIFLMLTLALRGPLLALLAILPTMLAVGLVLGLMGWLDVKLDMATALVASVALGLSVDDTFHCLLQFRRHQRDLPFAESIRASYSVTGPGVILSSVAVAIGFAALRSSQFEPFVNFGTMIGIATAGSSLGNLVLLPACLALGHRRSSRKETATPSGPLARAAVTGSTLD